MHSGSLETEQEKLKAKFKHYDIYVYKGWTLREIQDPIKESKYIPGQGWEITPTGKMKTTIVWGIHQPCGLGGWINIKASKVTCNRCRAVMPADVYANMLDALEMTKKTLDSNNEDV